jgi:hypothetical protein
MLKILFMILLSFNGAIAETIVIQSPSAKKRSKAILDKNFLFMKSNSEEAFTRETSSSNQSNANLHQAKPHASSSSLANINSSLSQIKKVQVTSLPKKSQMPVATMQAPAQKSEHKPNINIFDENNWDDYVDYEEIELEESLGVKAVIK